MKKKNKGFIIAVGIALLVAIICTIIFCKLEGISILDWITGKWGITFVSVFGLYIIVVITIISKDWIDKL